MTKESNKGYSLVELIVIIAIMVIIVSGTILGVSAISGKPAEHAASDLRTTIQNYRTLALGKYTTTLEIKVESTGLEVTAEYQVDASATPVTKKIHICGPEVLVEYSAFDNEDGDGTYGSFPDSGVIIDFNRSTGGINGGNMMYCFKFTKAGKSYRVLLYSLTGKSELYR